MKMIPKCPHLRVLTAHDEQFDEVYESHLCTLADKWCLMEADLECEVYNNWKEEQNVET